ncbi:MAG: LysR substrate-binding domain-containing protein [Roseovarius sp.]
MRLLTNPRTLHEVPQWLALLDKDATDFQSSFRFSSTALLLAAIRNGFGAGLVCRNLVQKEISTGELVAPVEKTLVTGDCYYIVKMPRMQNEKLAERLRNWFLDEANVR